MPHDIIDNSDVKLIEVLKEKLSICKRARFAIGWLFLTGFKELRNEIDKLEKLEVLAGARTNRQTTEALLLEKKWESAVADALEKTRYLPEDKRQKILDEEFKGLVNDLSYIKPSQENIEFLRWLLDKLNEGKIDIRIYYKEPFHAKLYLFEYEDQRHGLGEAIVGSSNFSLSGFRLNTELNVRVLGDDNYNDLTAWFDKRWQESDKTQFTLLAQKAIVKSWAFNDEVTPFRIYLKVLHEIFSYKEKPEIEIEADLYRFQKDAVIDAYQRLNKYNGVFIADVPGIGKTYVGAALLSHLESEGKFAIVIVPPRLVEYWEEVLREFGVAKAKVFSAGKLEEILENEKYLKRPVILIDESHHFRNPDTQKYRDIAKICEDKEVVLLSATPQNLDIWDIYWQLKLFTPYEAYHKFRIYPIELKKYFNDCLEKKANIEDLIAQIFIRRTRSDIREYYPEENIYFPTRKGPYRIDYSIDDVYEGGLYQKLQEQLRKLRYARYNLGVYAIKDRFDDDEFQRLTVAWKNLTRLVSISFHRRLESSIKAFQDSLSKSIRTYDGFTRILEEENKVFIGEVDEIEETIEQLENGEEVEFKEGENYYNADRFEVDELKRDLENDIAVLSEMFESVKTLTAKDDDKLATLINILNQDHLKGKKIIIFSSYESTVKYLHDEIKNKFEKVDFVSGGEKLLTKIKRFAPKANFAKIKPEEEIKILITTEVLSEGLNLQDGQIIINYELHWNPVRIIQRIGRIDRIGSEHDEIYVYNFFPETEAEKVIKVETRVSDRIKAFIHNFGYDEKTISLDEETVRKKLFEIYTEKPEGIEEIEEKSVAKYYELEFNHLITKYPDEYEKAIELPAMVNIARHNQEEGIIVFCRADDYYRLKMANLQGEIISSDDWEILKILECKRDTLGDKFNQSYFEIVEKVKEEFEIEANRREQDREFITDPVKKDFEKLIRWLKRSQSNNIKIRLDKLLDFVNKKQLSYGRSKVLRSLTKKYRRRFGLKNEQVLLELESAIYPMLENSPNVVKPEISPKYAQIIITEEVK